MIEKKAILVADVMEDVGNTGAAFAVRELIKQRAELLDALKAFVAYDEGDQEDCVQLMIDYNQALGLAKAAISKSEEAE